MKVIGDLTAQLKKAQKDLEESVQSDQQDSKDPLACWGVTLGARGLGKNNFNEWLISEADNCPTLVLELVLFQQDVSPARP